MGFGGYYLIIGVENTIATGTFETTLTARFVGTGETAKRLKEYKKRKKDAAKKKGKDKVKALQASGGCGEIKKQMIKKWNKLDSPFEDLEQLKDS